MKLETCDTCNRGGTHSPLVGVRCDCGHHFHFGSDLWLRTDDCIRCPRCEQAVDPLHFGYVPKPAEPATADETMWLGDEPRH